MKNELNNYEDFVAVEITAKKIKPRKALADMPKPKQGSKMGIFEAMKAAEGLKKIKNDHIVNKVKEVEEDESSSVTDDEPYNASRNEARDCPEFRACKDIEELCLTDMDLVWKENDPDIIKEIVFWDEADWDDQYDSFSKLYMPFLALIITGRKKNVDPCWSKLILADMKWCKLQPDDFFKSILAYFKSQVKTKTLWERVPLMGSNPLKEWTKLTEIEEVKRVANILVQHAMTFKDPETSNVIEEVSSKD